MLVAALVCMCNNAMAQSAEKQRGEFIKNARKELNEKSSKDARKEAKRYMKEGWKTTPGSLPLEKQLDRAYIMQMQYDDNMLPKYVMAEAMSIGENYDAAKLQAIELAKQNLAGQIQTQITALIENSVANNQMSAEQASSLTKTIGAGKNLISQNIGRTINVLEAYRELKNKNKEVLVRIGYNSQMAMDAAKNALRNEMIDEVKDLHGKLDEILGW